jgi:hypothetical protein
MKAKFEVIFLEQAIGFLEKLDDKLRKKIYYNIDKSKLVNNPKTIWVFANSDKNHSENICQLCIFVIR